LHGRCQRPLLAAHVLRWDAAGEVQCDPCP
jgi:hypothetical protein